MEASWKLPVKLKASSLWNPKLISEGYKTPDDPQESTFEFARTNGITAEAANVYPHQLEKLAPTEKITAWAATKARKACDAQLQVKGQNAAAEDPPGGPHKRLSDLRYEIRVLELHPGHFYGNLKGTLHHCSVEYEDGISSTFIADDERPAYRTRFALSCENMKKPVWYTALSYAWIDPTSSSNTNWDPATDTHIECNGFKLPITRSLEMALRHFRQTTHSINLWIDQICIDQSNNYEKEHQVALMSKIYTHAVNTVIWLGEATPGSDRAFKLLEYIGTVFAFEVNAPPPDEFERLFLPHAEDPIWKDLWDLMNREWFTRLWIVQEAILSYNPWILCGKTRRNWEAFANNFNSLIRSGLSSWLEESFDGQRSGGRAVGWKSMKVLSVEREHYYSLDGKLSLFSLLTSTRNARSADPRDKVYGLFGICKRPGYLKVSYDESVTAADVYFTATLQCVTADVLYFFPMLCCVDHEPRPGLPSWVPDWSSSRQTSSLGFSTSSAGIYHESGTWKPCFSYCPEGRELLVPGKIFDVIKDLGEVCTVPESAIEGSLSANQWLTPWVHLAEQCLPYPSGCKLFEAFWHTLVAGKDGEGRQKAPGSFEEIFSLLLDESTGKHPTFADQTYSKRQLRPPGKGKLELANLKTRAPAKTYQEIRSAVRRATRNRRLGVTEKKYLCLLPRHSKVGDIVCVFVGCHVPFVIRGTGSGRYQLVGECYVHGIMDGEVMDMQEVPHISVILS
ncbi:Heterokaryon incompatibility protein 6 [Lasiodiplodia hormozganensis]|uniref:Heterokaryon incompatibility protein 6 n=1 Tax=Lasiodiplodia hormozganensis TaxID=869390 RepID=A0AA39XQM8_9PEZI|nr:Heterokaryon incompatibility protein 6 [Lasiodiplodia hormozganensis]